jgi:proteasome lid subunit RPN8/RPN11
LDETIQGFQMNIEDIAGRSRLEIIEHAHMAFPNECCGVIIKTGKRQAVIACRNTSSTPHRNYRMHDEDLRSAEKHGEIIASYHSHCNQPPVPSEADKVDAEKNDLPCFIVCIPTEEFGFYAPCGYESALIGRPFVQGVLDCYTLFKDQLATRPEPAIDLPDFDREDDWWLKGQSLFLKHFPNHGFKRVFDGLKKWDGILMQLRSPVPNHCAVYLGDGLMIHHPPDSLSRIEPYVERRGFYAMNTYAIIRHSKFL